MLPSEPQAPSHLSPVTPSKWVPTQPGSVTGACSPPPAAGKGLVEAAHFCYLMAHVPFGHYTVKTDHLALLGSSHRYVMLWGKEAGRTFSRGLFEPSLGFMAPFSIFLCEFHLLLLLSSGGLFFKRLGREVPSGCCITPTGGLGLPQTAFVFLWGVLCPSDHWVAPWFHEQRSPRLTR